MPEDGEKCPFQMCYFVLNSLKPEDIQFEKIQKKCLKQVIDFHWSISFFTMKNTVRILPSSTHVKTQHL